MAQALSSGGVPSRKRAGSARDTGRREQGRRAMVLALLSSPPYGVRDAAACPQALGPDHYGQATRAPPVLLPRSGSYATPGRSVRVGFVVCGSRSGSRLRARRLVFLPGGGGSSRLGWFAFRW